MECDALGALAPSLFPNEFAVAHIAMHGACPRDTFPVFPVFSAQSPGFLFNRTKERFFSSNLRCLHLLMTEF